MTMPVDPFGGPSSAQIFQSVTKLKFPIETSILAPDPIFKWITGLEGMMFLSYPEITFGARSFNAQAAIFAHDIDKLTMDIRSFKVPLKRSVEQVLIPRIQSNFSQGGNPRWQPLADHTVYIRKGAAEPVLIRTGKLRRIATQKNMWWYQTITSNQQINAVEFDQRQLEAKAKYGIFHQFGAKLGNWELPSRMFVTMTGADQIEIEGIFYNWMVERADYHFYGFGNKPGRA